MLLDWVTARAPLTLFGDSDLARLMTLGDRIQRLDAATGAVVWETQAWDSIRSDSHHLSYRVGGDALWMQGSPARVIGDGDAVFGAGPARALDLGGCVARMGEVLGHALDMVLPDPLRWVVSRVDVTGNLLLPSLADVRQALMILRNCEGGRYRVSQQAGDTVYWSHRSKLKSGKAYAKGPHLGHLMRQNDYDGRPYNADEIEQASLLLRLELSLRAQWWRERSGRPWHEITPEQLKTGWRTYFERMMGDVEVTEMNIEQRVQAVAPTQGQAKAAIGCWALIKAYGWEKAREMSSAADLVPESEGLARCRSVRCRSVGR